MPTAIGAMRTAQRLRAGGALANPGDVHAIERLEARRAFIGRWLQAGVTIVPGTDAGVVDTPHDALLDELALYVDAGLTPDEARALASEQPGAGSPVRA